MAQGKRPLVIVALLACLGAMAGTAWLWPSAPKERTLTGYVVSHSVYLSAAQAGTVQHMFVTRGQRVAEGDPAFALDPTVLEARADELRGLMEQLRAKLSLETASLRKAEANYAHARTEAELGAIDRQRLVNMHAARKGSVAQSDLDHATSAAIATSQLRDAAGHEQSMAQERMNMARAEYVQAEARLNAVIRQLRDLAPAVPTAGRVDDVLYQPGEWVAGNAPVISLVPDAQMKVRFYVPQADIQQYKPGTRVNIACDGCSPNLQATVDFVASRPEYTPPVIYSLSNREDLVFLVEAAPDDPLALVVGQPMDITPVAAVRDSAP